MKVAALPSLRFSRSSSALWPPPTPCPATLPRFRVLPLYASLPREVSSAGPNRVSPVNWMVRLCVLPPDTPSRRFGSVLAVFLESWQASPYGHRLAPGITPVESAYSLVGLSMLKRRSLLLRPADSPLRRRRPGYRVNESLPELIPFNEQVHQVLSDALPHAPMPLGFIALGQNSKADPGRRVPNRPASSNRQSAICPLAGSAVATYDRIFRWPLRSNGLGHSDLAQLNHRQFCFHARGMGARDIEDRLNTVDGLGHYRLTGDL